MKVYLASYAMMTMGKISKNEGGVTGKRAVFIPTAGDPYENKDFVVADKIALQKYGIEVTDLDLKNKTEEEINKPLAMADILLVAGGDTFYLMEKLKESGADRAIKNFISRGGIYIGSSAGSIVCCPTIEGAEKFDNPNLAPNLKNFNGMGIFNEVIIPHTQKEKYIERIKEATEKLTSKSFKVYHLTDDDVLFFDGINSIVL
ncbi:hypothetical protein EUA79_01040 [TM7 phylum sp. oral taxon 351]|nr:hypothetical protein EUA79_01040 [TM7 phylum sp. oral taxon 351]